MTKKISEVLKEAKALISNPENWTQSAYARNSDQVGIDPNSKEAICFCSLGALYRVTDGLITAAEIPLECLRSTLKRHAGHYTGIADFNDSHTHAEVMELWDKAIAAAEAQENSSHE